MLIKRIKIKKFLDFIFWFLEWIGDHELVAQELLFLINKWFTKYK